MEYRQFHGRTYARSNLCDYWVPADNQQNDGLDLAHHWMTLLFDGELFLAPIDKNPQRVWDLGTGTGTWAIDFADAFPSAEVVGTDISPNQPAWVPPNCRFFLEDAEQDWRWSQNHFDFVHLRHLIGCIADWSKLYRQAFDCIKPGGYFQHADYDITTRSDAGPLPQDHIYNRWCNLFFEIGEKTGCSFTYPSRDSCMKELMEASGFVDVVHRTWKIPIGGWSPDKKMMELGLFSFAFVDESLEGFALYPMTKVLGLEYEKVQETVKEMKVAIRQGELKPYFILHVAYGKKPTH